MGITTTARAWRKAEGQRGSSTARQDCNGLCAQIMEQVSCNTLQYNFIHSSAGM